MLGVVICLGCVLLLAMGQAAVHNATVGAGAPWPRIAPLQQAHNRSEIVAWADRAFPGSGANLQSIGGDMFAVHWIATSGLKRRVVLIYTWQRTGLNDRRPWKLRSVIDDCSGVRHLDNLECILLAAHRSCLVFVDSQGKVLYRLGRNDLLR